MCVCVCVYRGRLLACSRKCHSTSLSIPFSLSFAAFVRSTVRLLGQLFIFSFLSPPSLSLSLAWLYTCWLAAHVRRLIHILCVMKSRESWRAIEFNRQRAEMMISRVDIFTSVVGTSGANFLLDDSTCSHFRTLHDAYIHAQVLLIPNGRIVHLRLAASERIFSYTSLAKLQRPYPPNKTSKLKNDEKKQGGGSKWGRRRKRAKEGKRKLKKKTRTQRFFYLPDVLWPRQSNARL